MIKSNREIQSFIWRFSALFLYQHCKNYKLSQDERKTDYWYVLEDQCTWRVINIYTVYDKTILVSNNLWTSVEELS